MTDFVQDVPTRDLVGMSMIVIISISILADLGQLIFFDIKDLHWRIKKARSKAQLKKEMKRRMTVMHTEHGEALNQE